MKLKPYQKSLLKQSFKNYSFPNIATQRRIAEDLGITETKVFNWFAAERKKLKTGKGNDCK